mgnify:CR=1 FL=1
MDKGADFPVFLYLFCGLCGWKYFRRTASGPIQPKVSIAYGGGIFTASLLAAAFAAPVTNRDVSAYGVMQGIGQGMIYSTIISTAQKWYLKVLALRPG